MGGYDLTVGVFSFKTICAFLVCQLRRYAYHKMWPIVIDVLWSFCSCLCVSVCLFDTTMSLTEMAELIDMRLGMGIQVCLRNHVLSAGPEFPLRGGIHAHTNIQIYIEPKIVRM